MQFYANRAESGRFRTFRTERQIRNNSTSQFTLKKFAIVPDCMQLYLWPFPCNPIFSDNIKKKPPYLVVFLELIAGFEPATSSLPRTCSTYWAISANEVFAEFWGVSAYPVLCADIPYQGRALPTEPYQQTTFAKIRKTHSFANQLCYYNRYKNKSQ